MPELILNCPQCQHPLRVPEDMQGRLVKCPACGFTFTVPAEGREAQPVLEVQPLGQAPGPAVGFDRERARSVLMPPAIFLLLTGLLGLVLDTRVWLTGVQIPDDARAMLKKQFEMEPPPPEQLAASFGLFAVVSAVVVLGAVQMLRARWYPLAVIASALAMINCGHGCCLLGLPAGIWCLVVLMRQDVRALFG
jgi:hypothetical protein